MRRVRPYISLVLSSVNIKLCMNIFAFPCRHSRLISSTKRVGVWDLWLGDNCDRAAADAMVRDAFWASTVSLLAGSQAFWREVD
jgi:hypothetical protein